MNNGKIKFTYWKDGNFYLGYLNEYPEFGTQGKSFEDLKEHLKDIILDINEGHTPLTKPNENDR